MDDSQVAVLFFAQYPGPHYHRDSMMDPCLDIASYPWRLKSLLPTIHRACCVNLRVMRLLAHGQLGGSSVGISMHISRRTKAITLLGIFV